MALCNSCLFTTRYDVINVKHRSPQWSKSDEIGSQLFLSKLFLLGNSYDFGCVLWQTEAGRVVRRRSRPRRLNSIRSVGSWRLSGYADRIRQHHVDADWATERATVVRLRKHKRTKKYSNMTFQVFTFWWKFDGHDITESNSNWDQSSSLRMNQANPSKFRFLNKKHDYKAIMRNWRTYLPQLHLQFHRQISTGCINK